MSHTLEIDRLPLAAGRAGTARRERAVAAIAPLVLAPVGAVLAGAALAAMAVALGLDRIVERAAIRRS